MKKTFLFALGAFMTGVSIFSTSCNQVKDAISKNIPNITWDNNDPVITIPASSNTTDQTVFGSTKFDLNQYIAANAGAGGIDFSSVKHVYVKSIVATLVNGDAGNNFSNLAYSLGSPALVFNTTPDFSTATLLGGSITTPPTDPYTLNIPVTNNTDIKTHMNGVDWVYGFTYKLSKATSKALQIKLDVQYELSFKD
jgi:hypothetical protein